MKSEQANNVRRPYNTRSQQVPFPSARDTRVPAVRGRRTGRFVRQARKFANKNKTMTEAAALRDETNFYRSRVKHMVEYTQKHTCKI
jgi:hypothetical protein